MKMKDYPRVGVGTYIFNDKGLLLLGKRKNAHGQGSWCPPGGALEWGETPEECAIRETMEEANISIKNLRPPAVTNDIFPETNQHYLSLHILAEFDSGEVCVNEPDKCAGWEWFNLNHLPTPLFIPVQNFIKTAAPFQEKRAA